MKISRRLLALLLCLCALLSLSGAATVNSAGMAYFPAPALYDWTSGIKTGCPSRSQFSKVVTFA